MKEDEARVVNSCDSDIGEDDTCIWKKEEKLMEKGKEAQVARDTKLTQGTESLDDHIQSSLKYVAAAHETRSTKH
ncbi:hypothetical protein GN244_ATG07912 [Phytophthora infestans]|uniref:Uncharacterized protein n=1 Tax=Phytophthora infestans TaxID=4787 RepID=A0A833WWC5_PHYIN|nr:hypothetical protein GN244_ATG07912 [Phytophthora infestans]